MDFESLVPTENIKESETVIKQKDERYSDAPSPWLWNGTELKEVPEDAVSFVYRITNKLNGKFYIGYKGFFAKKTRTVKGKKKHEMVVSNWITYWSSGEGLKKDLALLGVGNFKREILAFCSGRGIGKYVELFLQLHYGVLTHNKNNTYNGIVNVRLSSKTVTQYQNVIFCDELKDEIKL